MNEPTPARPSPSPPVGAIVLALLAGLLYCGMLAAIEDNGFSDNAGNAMDSAFSGLFGIALWIVLAGLLLIALANGKMPAFAGLAALVLLPLSAYASYVAANVYVIDHGWTLIVPILVPPVIVFYALWVRIPVLVSTISETTISALAGVALLYLIAASMWGAHLSALNEPAREARRQAEYEANQAADEKAAAEQRAQDEAKYAALGPDSPLSDFLDYIGGDDDRARHALDLARHANNRQADAIALLRAANGADNMSDLYRLNIEPTPELCATYNGALRTKATMLVPGYDNRIGEAIGLEFQMPNLKWLIAQHCDLTATLTDIAAKLRVIRDSSRIDQLADTFDALAKQ